jgi:hypothetical protein
MSMWGLEDNWAIIIKSIAWIGMLSIWRERKLYKLWSSDRNIIFYAGSGHTVHFAIVVQKSLSPPLIPSRSHFL